MTPNPMQKALEALARHPRCGAHSRRTGNPCRNPAMANGRCRMHGGTSPGAPKGERNGSYRHGLSTEEAKAERRAGLILIRTLRGLLRA